MTSYCWGNNTYGQLGGNDASKEDYLIPSQIHDFEDRTIEIVGCGWNHTIFLMNDGLVYSCGLNDHGQLGYRNISTEYSELEQVKSLEAQQINFVACGDDYTVVVNKRGLVFSFGKNDRGQLGIGRHDDSNFIPKQVKGLPTNIIIATVSCGKEHTIALSVGGEVFTWGSNEFGQLGVNGVQQGSTRVDSLVGFPVSQVAAGGYHSFVLTVSGTLFAWGKNSYGQLGLGHVDNVQRPAKLSYFEEAQENVRYILCGEEYTAVLTQRGEVFTFGFGGNGQLGHGCYENEKVPRKVVTLVGFYIINIACGRKHTLCYCAEEGSLFSFGLNVKGQLGVNSFEKSNKPMKASIILPSVQQPTLKKSQSSNENVVFRREINTDTDPSVTSNNQTDVFQVFAGGLKSFLTSAKNQGPTHPVYRVQLNSESLFFLTLKNVKELLADTLQRSILVLSTVFSHPACLNASFLQSVEGEQTNTSYDHGIRLMAVHQASNLLASNPSFQSIIIRSIKNSLFSNYINFSDWECLRMFVVLPEFLFISNSPEKAEVIGILANALLKLSSAQNILDFWWKSFPATFFERLVYCFKMGVEGMIMNKSMQVDEHSPDPQNLIISCLEMLKFLFNLNERKGGIVLQSTFYIKNLTKYINLKNDFFQMMSHPNQFAYFNYPFIFESKDKAVVMEYDAAMQMNAMVNNAHMQNLAGFVHGTIDAPVNPFLVLTVNRNYIIRDTLSAILAQDLRDLKKPLKVKFEDEDAEDAGGVRKEFFLLLMKDILDPQYGMFDFFKDSGTIWFKPGSFESPEMFLLIGVICGLAIYNSIIIDFPFPLALYKKLLDKPTELLDLMELKPDVGRSLQYMLEYADNDFNEVFGVSFQVTEQVFDEVRTIDLVEGGRNISVTQENKEDYVRRYVDHILNDSVEREYSAFADGFLRVCGGRVLRLFHPKELMQLIVGSNDYDLNAIQQVAEYKGEYHKNHPVIKNFWEAFHSFNLDTKKKFLAFLTGTTKVSILGIKHIKFIVQPVDGGRDCERLPVAHTCFNILDLPPYKSLELMIEKLRQAIDNCAGFGLV